MFDSEQLHQVLTRLAPEYAGYELHGELALGGQTLRFPYRKTGAVHEPVQWFSSRRQKGALHEPGLVAWLFALGELLEDKNVRFFDIGAAYGYFSAIASLAFDNCEIVAVEPNPALAEYVGVVLRTNRIERSEVDNVLLSDDDGEAELAMRNFHFFEPDDQQPEGYEPVTVQTRSLRTLLDRQTACDVDVLKIDTEGWQAKFLPPATPLLIERGAILLLECDRADKLEPYERSNAEIVAPFLDAGYRLLWCDHRDPAFTVDDLNGLRPEHERNALAVLLPPTLTA